MVLGSGSHSKSQVSGGNQWVDRIGDFQVPPAYRLAGRNRLAVHVPSSWYSASDNYIASNGGSTSCTSQQHRAGPKARTESWAMFSREDHVRNLAASSKDTAFARTLVRASFYVHVR